MIIDVRFDRLELWKRQIRRTRDSFSRRRCLSIVTISNKYCNNKYFTTSTTKGKRVTTRASSRKKNNNNYTPVSRQLIKMSDSTARAVNKRGRWTVKMTKLMLSSL